MSSINSHIYVIQQFECENPDESQIFQITCYIFQWSK